MKKWEKREPEETARVLSTDAIASIAAGVSTTRGPHPPARVLVQPLGIHRALRS